MVLTAPDGVPAVAQLQAATSQVVTKAADAVGQPQVINVEPGSDKVQAGAFT